MTLAARLAIGFATAVLVLGDPTFFRNMLLLPLRDLMAPIVWLASFMGNSIRWRGDTFTLKNGKLTRTA